MLAMATANPRTPRIPAMAAYDEDPEAGDAPFWVARIVTASRRERFAVDSCLCSKK
jgi:hypothetical protein